MLLMLRIGFKTRSSRRRSEQYGYLVLNSAHMMPDELLVFAPLL